MSMDKSAIELLQKSEAISAASKTIEGIALQKPLAILPGDFKVHDLESKLAGRVRYRGTMSTKSIRDYIAYVKQFGEAGSGCFVDADQMVATTLFNLGGIDNPGHGDFKATLGLDKTAEFKALLEINGQRQTQKDMAEFMEDYLAEITCYDAAGDAMDASRAIAAVRKVTIEATRKQESEENSFSAKRSAMEEIEAKSELGLPCGFRFECIPYNGLALRSFDLRLSVLTGGDRPMLVARIKRLEVQEQEMGEEFHSLLEQAFDSTEVETYIGSFSV